MDRPEATHSPLLTLPEDVRADLLKFVASSEEVSSIFLKDTHDAWVDELVGSIEVGDAVAIRRMLEARMALAVEALRELLEEVGSSLAALKAPRA